MRRKPNSRGRNIPRNNLPMKNKMKRTKICKYFSTGSCRLGSKCRFLHILREENEPVSLQELKSKLDSTTRIILERKPLLHIIVLYAGDEEVRSYAEEVREVFLDHRINCFLQIQTYPKQYIKPEHLVDIINRSTADYLVVVGDKNMKNRSLQVRLNEKLHERDLEETVKDVEKYFLKRKKEFDIFSKPLNKMNINQVHEMIELFSGVKNVDAKLKRIGQSLGSLTHSLNRMEKRKQHIPKFTSIQTNLIRLHTSVTDGLKVIDTSLIEKISGKRRGLNISDQDLRVGIRKEIKMELITECSKIIEQIVIIGSRLKSFSPGNSSLWTQYYEEQAIENPMMPIISPVSMMDDSSTSPNNPGTPNSIPSPTSSSGTSPNGSDHSGHHHHHNHMDHKHESSSLPTKNAWESGKPLSLPNVKSSSSSGSENRWINHRLVDPLSDYNHPSKSKTSKFFGKKKNLPNEISSFFPQYSQNNNGILSSSAPTSPFTSHPKARKKSGSTNSLFSSGISPFHGRSSSTREPEYVGSSGNSSPNMSDPPSDLPYNSQARHPTRNKGSSNFKGSSGSGNSSPSIWSLTSTEVSRNTRNPWEERSWRNFPQKQASSLPSEFMLSRGSGFGSIVNHHMDINDYRLPSPLGVINGGNSSSGNSNINNIVNGNSNGNNNFLPGGVGNQTYQKQQQQQQQRRYPRLAPVLQQQKNKRHSYGSNSGARSVPSPRNPHNPFQQINRSASMGSNNTLFSQQQNYFTPSSAPTNSGLGWPGNSGSDSSIHNHNHSNNNNNNNGMGRNNDINIYDGTPPSPSSIMNENIPQQQPQQFYVPNNMFQQQPQEDVNNNSNAPRFLQYELSGRGQSSRMRTHNNNNSNPLFGGGVGNMNFNDSNNNYNNNQYDHQHQHQHQQREQSNPQQQQQQENEGNQHACSVCGRKPVEFECSTCANFSLRGIKVERTFFCSSQCQQRSFKKHKIFHQQIIEKFPYLK